MMMRNEDVSQPIQRHARKCKLSGDAIAAIDDIRQAIRHDDLR
jgi:hypothetical protein